MSKLPGKMTRKQHWVPRFYLRHFADSKVGIPYGVALGFAGLAIYPKTALVGWALARLAA